MSAYTRTCPECGQTFETSDHRKQRCSRPCFSRYQARLFANRITKQCEECGAPFDVPPHKAETARFCSRACKAATRTRTGHVLCVCKVCGQSFTRKASRAGDYCSYACMGVANREQVTVVCEVCGKAVETNVARAVLKRYCSRACARIGFVESVRPWMGRRGETGPERQVHQALQALGVLHLPQYPLDGYLIDFYLPLHAVALEVDGQYWHTRPEVSARDQRRDAHFLELGITTVRITDTELEQTSDLPNLLRSRLKL